MKLNVFVLIITFVLSFSPIWASTLKPTGPQEDPTVSGEVVDSTRTETSPTDSLETSREEQDTAAVSPIPTDTTDILSVPADSVTADDISPKTSSMGRSVRDRIPPPESPDDTTGLKETSVDTVTVEADTTDTSAAVTAEPDTAALVPPDTVSLEPDVGPDTTAIEAALIDTIFGRIDTAYVGEVLFTNERTLPFSAFYTYRYTGLQDDTTFGVELITDIMQRMYRSRFHYPPEGGNIVAIGPYDVEIITADSLQFVFELKGFVQLPEIEIPEPVEEVAEPIVASVEGQPQLKASPTNPDEYFSRAYIRASEGNYDEAKKDLGTTLEMDSTFFEARLMLGWILSEENDSGAVEIFKKCSELKPNDVNTSLFFAHSLKKFESSDEAFQAYSKIIEADSSNSQALFQQALFYKAQGDSQQAETFFENARGFQSDIDSLSAIPSLSDIPHEYWWIEEGLQLTHFEEPQYPASAAEESLECVVDVTILVDEGGNPAEVEIDKPCDHAGFNDAAESAAWKCTFTPGTHKGVPVRVWTTLPFRFELPEAEVVIADSTATSETDTSVHVSDIPEDVDVTEAPADTGEVRPKLIGFIKPKYPQQAMEDSIETTVLLNVLVGPDGSVREVTFIQPDTLIEAFNVEAEKTARRCRFQPGLRNGTPDTMWAELPVTFSLTSPPSAPEMALPTPGRRPPLRETKAPQAGTQDKAAAYVEATMLAAQEKYDEALEKVIPILKVDAKDKNAQLLYGLINLAKDAGKRVEDVAPLAHGTEADSYWWVDTMPEIVELKEAAYPEAAKASQAGGTVILYALVSENGSVAKVIRVAPADEESLNTAAEAAAKGCTFTPGMLSGEAVKVWSRLSYEFKPSE